VAWSAVSVEGIFEQDLSPYSCDVVGDCIKRQDQALIVPDYLFSQIESQVVNDLKFSMAIPSDAAIDDKQSLLRA
jgi:hypothetical protein